MPHITNALLPSVAEFNSNAKHVQLQLTQSVFESMRANLATLAISNDGGWSAHVPSIIKSDEEKVNYLCMVVAIDYRHWGFGTPLEVGNKVDKKDFYADILGVGRCRGSQAMVELLKQAGSRGVQWHTPAWLLSDTCGEELRTILRGMDNLGNPMDIPDFNSRILLLKQIAQELTRRQTDFYSILVSCSGKIQGVGGALEALKGLHCRFVDEAQFNGATVPLMKLAQLTLMAVISVVPLFESSQVDTLEICPDYQVPKALLAIGALRYSPALTATLEGGLLLGRDSEEEVEIRLGSVLAAHVIRRELMVSPTEIDFVLWKAGRECSSLPHHLCETIMY